MLSGTEVNSDQSVLIGPNHVALGGESAMFHSSMTGGKKRTAKKSAKKRSKKSSKANKSKKSSKANKRSKKSSKANKSHKRK